MLYFLPVFNRQDAYIMESNRKPPYKKRLLQRALVEGATLTRYAVRGREPDKQQPVMRTLGEVAFFDKGVTNWKLDLSNAKPVGKAVTGTPHVQVRAEWCDTQLALEKGVEVVYGGSANSFGSMGALLVPEGFHIPTVTATRENVRHYGLQLIENKEVFAVSSPQFEIVMMRYEYGKDYKKNFLMQKYGGGGIFVETHDFPHIHVPTSESCGGYIVIGKPVAQNEFHFTAYRIPYGYALYTPSGTIHGDGTLVGVYALTVADSAFVPADTVLMYNRNTLAMARGVVPDWKA